MKSKVAKTAIATTTFACALMLSIDSSGQGTVSLSVESAQARIGRPLTPVSVAGVARRQNRRAAYGYGYGYGAGMVGAGVAVGAATVAAATSPWGYQPMNAYADAGGLYATSPWGNYECRIPHAYDCQPYSHIDWYH